MTRHQYGISALVFQTSFRGDSVGGVVKCRLFSQATNELISYPDLTLFYTEKCGRSGYEITNESDFCYFIFQFNGMSGTTLCLASISTLCCISADRYFAVVRPMRYKHVLTPKRALCMLALVWLVSLCFSCLPLITDYEYHVGTNNCSPAWRRSCGLYAFMTVFAFGMPLVILLSTYGMIFSSIRRHTKKVSHWRISSSGHHGTRNREVRGSDPTYDSFISNSALDKENQNRVGVKVDTRLSPDNTPNNSMQDVRGFEREDEFSNRRNNDRKYRSHSAGCPHIKPDENFLPFVIQMKASAKTKDDEANSEPRPRSCSVNLEFSVSGIVPGTVSTMFNGSNATDHSVPSTAKALSLSYTNVNSTESNDLTLTEWQEISTQQILRGESPSADLNGERVRTHSINVTVTTASTPVNELENNVPGTLSLNGFMSPTNEDSTDLFQRMRKATLSPPPPTNFHPLSFSNHLEPPTIALPTHAQFVRANSPAPSSQKNYRSRSRSLSFERSSEKYKRSKNSFQASAVQKIGSPLLRLRAITQFKRRLRVSALPREYKIAKTGFILVLVFFFSWGPYMMAHNCKSSSETPLWVYRASMWLVYLSCVLNPIVYALSSKHIRVAFTGHMKFCKKLDLRKSESQATYPNNQIYSGALG